MIKLTTILSLCFTLFVLSPIGAQNNMKSFIFGHSLLDHRPPLIPTPSDETTVAHWMYLLANEAGFGYAVAGQYGFLPQHANLPPFSQWGYDIVPPAWDSDFQTFAQANFNNILITAGNFIQWQPPHLPYPGQGGITPLSATRDIINWADQEEPGIPIYIYENWPDMAPYLSSGSFPPNSSDLANYHSYTQGSFHNWWLEYHDSLLLSNPTQNVRMIPVGPILSDLYTNTVLNQIPVTELYEDDAPHGRATTYFLAALITYMATYEVPAPTNYTVPNIIHATVRNNYSTVVNHIWSALMAFNLPNGDSRVFFNNSLPVELVNFEGAAQSEGIRLSWQTANEQNNDQFKIEHSRDGQQFQTIGSQKGQGTTSLGQYYSFLHTSGLEAINYYRLKQIDFDGSSQYSPIIAVEFKDHLITASNLFPNPSLDGRFQIHHQSRSSEALDIQVFDAQGSLRFQTIQFLANGANDFPLDLSELEAGLFIIQLKDGQKQHHHKVVIKKR